MALTDIFIVLDLDGKPSGRAIVRFGSPSSAREAMRQMAGGKRLMCGSLDRWPNEPPKARHIVVRPLRSQERGLALGPSENILGPSLAVFPVGHAALEVVRCRSIPVEAATETNTALQMRNFPRAWVYPQVLQGKAVSLLTKFGELDGAPVIEWSMSGVTATVRFKDASKAWEAVTRLNDVDNWTPEEKQATGH